MREKKLTHTIVFRVDDDLYIALQLDAWRNGRTITQTVRFKLRELAQEQAAARVAAREQSRQG